MQLKIIFFFYIAMGIENEPLPTNIIVPIETLEDADLNNQSIFYNTTWSSSNLIPIPCVLSTWETPILPTTEGRAHLYIKEGSDDLFLSTKLSGEKNITSSTGSISGPGLSVNNAIVRWSGVNGTVLKNSTASIDDSGNLTATSFKIGVNSVLSGNTLGATITDSSLTSAKAMDLQLGQMFSINSIPVLSSNALGSGIFSSSLTNVGTLVKGSIGSGFGSINISSTITCGDLTASQYKISSYTVLTSTALGSTVISSSLRTLGILDSLAIGEAADASAILTVTSSHNDKGALLPRMTTVEKNLIDRPATGLLVYDTTQLNLSHYNGTMWSSLSSSNPVVVTVNSSYSLTTATDVLICTATANVINITLPTAIGISGKIFRLIRTDTTFSYAVTITVANTNPWQTIGGSTTRYMWTANESWAIISDGSNWQIISHIASTDWFNDGAIRIESVSNPQPVKPNAPLDKNCWRRVGNNMEISMIFNAAGTGSSAGNGDYTFHIPQYTNLLIENAVYTFNTSSHLSDGSVIGAGYVTDNAGNNLSGTLACELYDRTSYRLMFVAVQTSGNRHCGIVGSSLFSMSNSSNHYTATLNVAITNWDP